MMTDTLEKYSFNETSLPQTQSSFTGLHSGFAKISPVNNVIQQPSTLPNNHSAAQQSFSAQQTPQCRICLQSQAQSGQSFITPCNCIGTVQYIHLTCFTQWVRTSLAIKLKKQLQQIQQSGVKCQLCKMSLEINMSMQKTFVGWQKLKQKINKSPFYFSILVFMLISTIFLLCFSSAMLPSSPFTFPSQLQSSIVEIKEKALQKVTMFCSLIVSLILLILLIFLLGRDFIIGYRMKLWSNGKNGLQINLKGILQY